MDWALAWIDQRHDHPYSSSSTISGNHLFIWHVHGFRKIAVGSIIYLKASRSYCEIYLLGHDSMIVSVPMSAVVKHLNPNIFMRIHRGYVVNLDQITAFVGNNVVTKEAHELPIGKEFRKVILGKFILIGSKSRKYSI